MTNMTLVFHQIHPFEKERGRKRIQFDYPFKLTQQRLQLICKLFLLDPRFKIPKLFHLIKSSNFSLKLIKYFT